MLIAALATVMWAGSCSESDGSRTEGTAERSARAATNARGQDGPGSSASGTDFGNPTEQSEAAPMPADNGGTRGATPQPGPAEDCGKDVQRAMRVEVDMYIMLDRSGSMLAETDSGETKWDAIRDALTTFVQDPESSGLGVGLQYFPLGVEGVPESCVSDTECGARGGPCTNRACLPGPFTQEFMLIPCLNDNECPTSSRGCGPIGVCEEDESYACYNFDQGCGRMGACLPLAGECLGFATCEPSAYETPAVEIGVLPENGSNLVDSLMNANPTGLTPTGVALVGAIAQARARALANPTHRVIALLATDGLPTDCVPPAVTTLDEAVDAVALEASDGVSMTPSVPTYVIGVFSPEEPEAMPKLDQIAQAGGTDRAFIVDATADVSQQFLDVLAQIRAGSLACEFQLPTPPEGEELDPMLVNVDLTRASGATETLAFVGDASGCGQVELEWYYEAGAGGEMTINTCASTCQQLQAEKDATVQIRIGCPTRGPQ